MRSTADVNLPTGEAEAFRMNAMFQEGKISTRNQTEVLDFGMAPSYKLGIGKPTEVTLYALLQHNHDKVDYGLPPLNGYPAKVNRNNAYGFNNDFTNQDVIMLGSTIEHKFDKDLKLRNQTQFNYVNTYAIETAPQRGSARCRPTAPSPRCRPTPVRRRRTRCRLSATCSFASRATTATSSTPRSTTRPS